MKKQKKKGLQELLWIVQGFIVGIGAILPGVSGGTLCYAFGIYEPIVSVLSNPIKGIKKYFYMLIFVGAGAALGFVGFAGVTNFLLNWNEAVVLCVFVGLIAGTLPGIWKDAGENGRGKSAYISLAVSFAAISAVFYVFKNILVLTIEPNTVGWLICGVLWGLSFIIPGFSSSTLLLFFGIYEKMSAGISHLDMRVLIPLGISMLATLLLLSRVMKTVFDRFYGIASHCVLGFVTATTLMIIPSFNTSLFNIFIYIICIISGGFAAFLFTIACDKIKGNSVSLKSEPKGEADTIESGANDVNDGANSEDETIRLADETENPENKTIALTDKTEIPFDETEGSETEAEKSESIVGYILQERERSEKDEENK